jgi:hypothetical protein
MSPGKRKAPEGTGADAKTNLPPIRIVEAKYAGKVRPAPRESGTTHYGCSCCRWSA